MLSHSRTVTLSIIMRTLRSSLCGGTLHCAMPLLLVHDTPLEQIQTFLLQHPTSHPLSLLLLLHPSHLFLHPHPRTGRFGFIRCLSSDEKLFWHSSGSAACTNQNDLQEGVDIFILSSRLADYCFCILSFLSLTSLSLCLSISLSLPPYLYRAGREVSFQMRRRGGLRCAVNIRVRVLFSLSSPFYCLPPPILLDSSLNRSLNLQVNPFSILLYSGLLSFPLDIFNLPHASHH